MSVLLRDDDQKMTPKQIIEWFGFTYLGENELGCWFNVADGSTLLIKGVVSAETVTAKLCEHERK